MATHSPAALHADLMRQGFISGREPAKHSASEVANAKADGAAILARLDALAAKRGQA